MKYKIQFEFDTLKAGRGSSITGASRGGSYEIESNKEEPPEGPPNDVLLALTAQFLKEHKDRGKWGTITEIKIIKCTPLPDRTDKAPYLNRKK